METIANLLEKEKGNNQKFSDQITGVKVEISFTRDK